jgi:hypothetical protein
MVKGESLIILDWDDTLFPTSWVIKNKINLSNEDHKNKNIVFFSQLDNLLYKLLLSFMEYGTVVIVTNAMVKWVNISSDILPNTKRLIRNNIRVISAREKHQKSMPGDMFGWKRVIFKDLVLKYFNKNSNQNIISVGDADYEFKALIELWNKKNKKRVLKTVRFLRSPNFDSLIDQLEVLSNSVQTICRKNSHMDLKFNKKVISNKN